MKYPLFEIESWFWPNICFAGLSSTCPAWAPLLLGLSCGSCSIVGATPTPTSWRTRARERLSLLTPSSSWPRETPFWWTSWDSSCSTWWTPTCMLTISLGPGGWRNWGRTVGSRLQGEDYDHGGGGEEVQPQPHEDQGSVRGADKTILTWLTSRRVLCLKTILTMVV